VIDYLVLLRMALQKIDQCPCCGRTAKLTFHHLIPKKMHRRPFFRKKVDKADKLAGIMICRQCHDALHRFFDEMTLAKKLNTLDAILADPQLAKHFQWVAKQSINVK
jgi:hypothetical protein